MGFLKANRSRVGTILACAAMTLSNYAPAAAKPDHKLLIPAGTVVPMKLDHALSSKNAQPGDKFTATVKEGRDDAGLPPGTRVEGVVREAIPHEGDKPGVLDVDIRRLVTPDNKKIPIDGSLFTLNGKDVKRQDGRLVASPDKNKDRLKWVGIGAGAGILISALTKGNVIVNSLLGAGAGAIFNELTNKKPGDVNLKEGSEFGIRLDKQVAVTVNDRDYERYQGRFPEDKGDDRQYRRDRPAEDNRGNDDIGVVIDNREVKFGSTKPFMRRDVVMVPLEPVSKMGDFGYRYDSGDKTVRARDGKLRLAVGSRVAFVNGERRLLPAPSEMKDGMIYVPMQFIGWLTNGSATWDSGSRTVIVTTERDR